MANKIKGSLDDSQSIYDVSGENIINKKYITRISNYKKTSQLFGLVIIIAAILVILGWLLNIPILRGEIFSLYGTKFNTAIIFLLAGTSLFLANKTSKKYPFNYIANILALIVFLSGLVILFQHITGINLGMDQLFFTQPFKDPVELIPGRTKFLSSIIFVIMGLALLLMNISKKYYLYQLLAFIGGFIALSGFTATIYGVRIIQGADWYVQMALLTSIIHMFLAIGILTYKPDKGFMKTITSPRSGGIISRLLLGNLFIIIILLGFIQILGNDIGLYGSKTGTVIITISISIIILSLVLWSANKLNILDEKREKAILNTKELEKFYGNIIESVNEGIFVTDMNDQIIYYNKAFRSIDALNGFDVGTDVINKLPQLNREYINYYLEAKDTLKPVYYESIPIKTPSQIAYFTGWILPEVKNNKFNGALCTIINDTDRWNAAKQIENSLKEKEMLLGEIHHRVKNNLQIISSLLNLQSIHIKDPFDKELFTESQNRVKSMAIIHEKLYQSQNFTKINLKDYTISLLKDIMGTYMTDPDQIRFELDADNIELNLETAIPCGLILNELITNSIKHAFPSGSKGNISIKFREDNGMYQLEVADDGVGFPEDLDLENAKSLGLELINNLVNQLDGNIELESNHGTRFIINFSEIKYRKRI
ncbi:MAG: histidine kinase dimerization/phosphoacceptor domain -containing protein [Methanobacteriaceae archaeon]|nr:histidine kinase dimerization/phosphoacceptor domain -containing protein [Methanobacteriaceae archaeon]